MPDPFKKVHEILDGFQQNGRSYIEYLQSDPSDSDEAEVRVKIVQPLLQALGYDLQVDLDPEKREGANAFDILVKADDAPVMLWELKRTQDEDLAQHEDQLTRYVLLSGVGHAVLCNGRKVRVYQRIGDVLRFSYEFSLTVFASDATSQPSPHDRQGLQAFFASFNKEAFQEVEKQKNDIINTTTSPRLLHPQQGQNESLLIKDLKREIKRLHRSVFLRFRSYRRRYNEFEQENEKKRSKIAEEREELKKTLEITAQHAQLSVDIPGVLHYLDDFSDSWMDATEDVFVDEVLAETGVEQELTQHYRDNLDTRLREFYRTFTDHARWYSKQRMKLRPIISIVEDFEHWRDEIGVMAKDPESEFSLQTVYIFVTRLLLIRICEDKGLIKQKISDGGYKDYLKFSEDFFTNIADAQSTLLDLAYKDTSYIYGHFFTSDVFDWYTWQEEDIVRLFWTLNRYDFKKVSADLIGHIYEQYVDELERKRKGQFYTPPQVVNYMLDQVGYEGTEIIGQRLLDPACGSGRFLVEAARRLVKELRQQTNLSPKELVNERLRNSLFGMDVNRFACFLAEVNLLVEVLDLLGDDQESKFTVDRFHIYPTNTLIPQKQEVEPMMNNAEEAPSHANVEEKTDVAQMIKMRGQVGRPPLDFGRGFDYVVGNPPYVRADTPGVSDLRSRIESTGRYETLYKKWDLYIPFIEFAVQSLAEDGWHAFIVSDAYQTEEYASRSREFLLNEATIENLTFAPDVKFFDEAQVRNLIYAVRKRSPSESHKIKRLMAEEPMLRSQDLKELPALSQTKWGEQIFRPAFVGDDGLDLSNCAELGEICYINTGLEPQSHEKYDPVIDGTRRKLFVKDDLLSDHRTETNSKPYVEADDMGRYVLHQIHWLEWGTKRVPKKLRRARFPELFGNSKIMVALAGNSFYDHDGSYCNLANSVSNCVPYHKFQSAAVKKYVARVMARSITGESIEKLQLSPAEQTRFSKSDLAEKIIENRARESSAYDLRYITALINCRWLQGYMMAFVRRGSRRRFYPNDLKQWPIAKANAEAQSKIGELVDGIMSAKDDVQRWRDDGHRIDEEDIVLNPRPFLDIWGIHHCDLIDASGFVEYDINGSITTIEPDGERVVFRKRPLSYIESQHDHVLDYLKLYLETNKDALDAVPASEMDRKILIPRSPSEVKDFLVRLEDERQRVMLRWMVATQRENLIEEVAFDLYDVEDDRREKLSAQLYNLEGVPDGMNFVSILKDDDDSPMRRIAFEKDGAWGYRTEESFSPTVLLWMHDGQQVTRKYGVVNNDTIEVASQT